MIAGSAVTGWTRTRNCTVLMDRGPLVLENSVGYPPIKPCAELAPDSSPVLAGRSRLKPTEGMNQQGTGDPQSTLVDFDLLARGLNPGQHRLSVQSRSPGCCPDSMTPRVIDAMYDRSKTAESSSGTHPA